MTRQADPAAAIRLREELARARSENIGWSSELFDSCIRRALVGQSWAEKASWRTAFWSTRKTWRLAYQRRLDVTVKLDVALLAQEPDDEPTPAHRMVLIA